MGVSLVGPSKEAERRLWLALTVSSLIAAVEFTGGLLGQSLALVSDSGHVLTDVLTIGVGILTLRLARKPHSARRTFGYHRAEIFAALVNGSTLIAIALVILYEGYRRVLQPLPVQGPLVLAVATFGLFGNLVIARVLVRSRKTSLNVGGVFLHVVGDTLSSIGVIVGSLIVIYTSNFLVDPLVAILIGILILRSAYGLVRESTDILLEATPKHLELEAVARAIQSVEGVGGVHDLHVWTITSGLYALSGHITVASDTIQEGAAIREKVAQKLRESFGIEHVTLQLEREALENIQRDGPGTRI